MILDIPITLIKKNNEFSATLSYSANLSYSTDLLNQMQIFTVVNIA